MATDPNVIQLSPEQRALVAELADQSGEAWPEMLQHALAEYARHRGNPHESNGGESFAEAGRRLGVIGCLTGGPADLSTNPAHFERFGQGDE